MAAARTGVLGSFVHVDAATDAIRALRGQGHGDLTVYSAAPNHEIEEALAQRVSPVRLFTLIGGLTGCAAGFGMTLWMSHDWPVVVGGKPIGSIPPFHWQPPGFRSLLELSLLDEPLLGVGAGQWGEEILIAPADLVRASGAAVVNLTRRD